MNKKMPVWLNEFKDNFQQFLYDLGRGKVGEDLLTGWAASFERAGKNWADFWRSLGWE